MASRRAILRISSPARLLRSSQIRSYSTSPPRPPQNTIGKASDARARSGIHPDELEQLLAEPTWSVESLLPPKTGALDAPQISSQTLHHLLRLSALPPPETAEQEQKMLDNLAAQLHFVGKIQQVDTTGVKPLQAIRDETKAAEEEQTITVSKVRNALKQERVIGVHHKRIERDTTQVDATAAEDWDVLGSAEKTIGKYFVVESERPQS